MIGRLGAGVAALFEGARLLVTTPRLWPYALAPVALAAVALGLGILGGIELMDRIDERFFAGMRDGVLAPVRWLALALGYVVSVVAAFILAKTLILPIAGAPFNELLSERVEVLATGRELPWRPFGEAMRANLVGAWRGVGAALYGVAVQVLFLPLLFLPVVGAVLYLVPSAYVEAWNALDVTLGRKGLTLAARREWLRRNRGESIGLGAAVLALNLVPLAGLFAVPSAVAGGTLLVARGEAFAGDRR